MADVTVYEFVELAVGAVTFVRVLAPFEAKLLEKHTPLGRAPIRAKVGGKLLQR